MILPDKIGARWLFWLSLWGAWAAALAALYIHPAFWVLFAVVVVAAIFFRPRSPFP